MKALRWLLPVLLTAAILLPAAVASASDARLDALGVQYEYLEDYALFHLFPTVAARYSNLVTASLGGRDAGSGAYFGDRSVGVIGAGDNTSYGVFALYLNQQTSDARFSVTDENGNPVNLEQTDVDLTWARNFSQFALGLGVRWQSSRWERGEVEVTPAWRDLRPGANQFSVVGGVKFDVGTTDNVELAAELASLTWKVTDSAGQVTTEDAGNLSYRFTARMMTQVKPGTMLVPLLLYSHLDGTGERDLDDTYSNRFNAGVAVHHEVNGNDLLIMGVAANYMKRLTYRVGPTSYEFSRWDMPALFVALEFDVYSWLTARVGATKTVDLSSVDYPQEDSPNLDAVGSRYFFGLGMGLHFEHFDVDATVNPDAVFTGGYLFSGESSRPLTRVTGTYYF